MSGDSPPLPVCLLCVNTETYDLIFDRTLPYFSRTLLNETRDWEKVGRFCKYLEVLDKSVDQHSVYTNEFVPAMGKPAHSPITDGGVLQN